MIKTYEGSFRCSFVGKVLVGCLVFLLGFSKAYGEVSCSQIFSVRKVNDFTTTLADQSEAIASVPALGHLTSLRGLVGILSGRALKPHNKVSGWLKNKNIGGSSESVYLAPVWKSVDVQQKTSNISGPTILLSTSLLHRKDYFYNLDTWARFGDFSGNRTSEKYQEAGSYLPHELNPARAKRMAEILFSSEINVRDYVIGIWIPKNMRIPFEALCVMNGVNWRNSKIPIYFEDQLPSIEQIRGLNQAKEAPLLKKEHFEVHPAVERNIEYNFGTAEALIGFIEKGQGLQTSLGQAAIEALKSGAYSGLIHRDYNLVLRRLRLLLAMRAINQEWIDEALTHPEAHKYRAELDVIIGEARARGL